MATSKKDKTEYCFLHINTLGNVVSSINIVNDSSLAKIKKAWLGYGPNGTTPIFKGIVPSLPKKKSGFDTEIADAWNKLAIGTKNLADSDFSWMRKLYETDREKSPKKGRKQWKLSVMELSRPIPVPNTR